MSLRAAIRDAISIGDDTIFYYGHIVYIKHAVVNEVRIPTVNATMNHFYRTTYPERLYMHGNCPIPLTKTQIKHL